MTLTVEFNAKLFGRTVEIENVSTEAVLSPEFSTVELRVL